LGFNLEKRLRTKQGEALTEECSSYVEIMKANGLVRIPGERWDRPAVVDDAKIDAIRQVLDTEPPVVRKGWGGAAERLRSDDLRPLQ